MTDVIVWLIVVNLLFGFIGWLMFRPRNHVRGGSS